LVSHFVINEKSIYNSMRLSNKTIGSSTIIKVNKNNSHIVQNGENLSSIAKKYKISLDHLKKWNGLQTNYLIEGQRLVITNKKQDEDDGEML